MKRDSEFLKKVRKLAAENNMGATAKVLKIPVYKLKARLLSASTKLGEVPPRFARTRAVKKIIKAKKRKHFDTVRAVGKAGISKRFLTKHLKDRPAKDVVFGCVIVTQCYTAVTLVLDIVLVSPTVAFREHLM